MAYRVKVDPAGYEFTCEEGENVLEAALRQDLPFPYSCKTGKCAACLGKLLAGTVRYGKPHYKALQERERQAGYALLCQAIPTSDLHLHASDVSQIRGITIRSAIAWVVAVDRLSGDVIRLRLKALGGRPLAFAAGQYVDCLIGEDTVRSFSLANAPEEAGELELHVRLVPEGEFTSFVFSEMRPRHKVRIKGPLGTFFLRDDSDRPAVLVAGGTGFAPIKSMVEHTLHAGLTRPLHVYWGARAKKDLYLADLPQSWAAAHDNIRYTPVLSEPDPADGWEGRTGYVHEAVLADYADLAGHQVYAAGPPPMVDAIRETFPGRGLELDHLFYDPFYFAWELEKSE